MTGYRIENNPTRRTMMAKPEVSGKEWKSWPTGSKAKQNYKRCTWFR